VTRWDTERVMALEIDPNTVRPGWVALLIVLALVGATVLLWRNMGKQMRKIDFDESATDDAGRQAGRKEADAQQPPPADDPEE
jgi:hypothetical protein